MEWSETIRYEKPSEQKWKRADNNNPIKPRHHHNPAKHRTYEATTPLTWEDLKFNCSTPAVLNLLRLEDHLRTTALRSLRYLYSKLLLFRMSRDSKSSSLRFQQHPSQSAFRSYCPCITKAMQCSGRSRHSDRRGPHHVADPDIRLRGRGQFNMFPSISHLFLRWRGGQSLQSNWTGGAMAVFSPAGYATDAIEVIRWEKNHVKEKRLKRQKWRIISEI